MIIMLFLGAQSSLNWIREYEFYFHDKTGDVINFLINIFNKNVTQNIAPSNASPTKINFCKLGSFLNSVYYRHWNAFLQWENNK